METTRYTISSDPVDYGEDCKDGVACAEKIKDQLEFYAADFLMRVEIAIVPETASIGNRSTGDQDIIDQLDRVREHNWADWI